LPLALWLVLAAAGVYAVTRIAPPYVTHYLLRDDVVQIARAPVTDDHDVLERLLHSVREHGLEDEIASDCFQIETGPRWRAIRCEYDAIVEILPGLRRRLRFRIHVDEPYLPPREVQFF